MFLTTLFAASLIVKNIVLYLFQVLHLLCWSTSCLWTVRREVNSYSYWTAHIKLSVRCCRGCNISQMTDLLLGCSWLIYEDLKSSCISITWKLEKNFSSIFYFDNYVWQISILWNSSVFKLFSCCVTLSCLENYLKMLCSSPGVDKESM